MKILKFLAALVFSTVTASPQRLSSDQTQWKRIGPEGGIVAATVASPRNPSTLYAATCGGSLFKTADGGATWNALDSLPNIECNPNAGLQSAVLALDPQDPAIAYAANCSDIFKTIDGGATWTRASSLRTPICLQSLVIGSKGTLFATRGAVNSADSGEIWKSTDRGLTWTQVSSGVALLAIDPQNEQTMYATGAGWAAFKSTDGGMSWNTILPGPPRVSSLVIDPQNSSTLYARANWQILKSVDGGANWTPLNFGLNPAPAQSFDDGVRAIAISAPNPARVYAIVNRFSDSPGVGPRSDFFLVMSSDAGMTWTALHDPHLAMADLVTILPDPQDESTVYLGTTGGMLKSTDSGAHWDFANSGLKAVPVRQVVVDPKSGALLSVTDPAGVWHGTPVFKTTDAARSWSSSSAGLPWGIGYLVADPQNPHALYSEGPHNAGAGSFFGGGLFKSEDSGSSWSEIWYDSSWGASLYPLVISPNNPSVLYAGSSVCSYGCVGRIARSDDAGRTWTRPQSPLSTEEYISALAIDPRNPNVVYAGTADLGGWGTGGLFKSVDGGVTWRKISDGAVNMLLIDPANPDTVVSGGLSKDGGETSGPLNLPCDQYFPAIAFDPQGSGALYCGDNAKVFRTADGGKNWTQVGTGLRGRVESFGFDALGSNTLYAATSGGIFAAPLTAGKPRRSGTGGQGH